MSLIISSILILLIKVYKDYLKGNERKNNISDWAYLAVILSVIIQFFLSKVLVVFQHLTLAILF